jgi:hypothetical protein
MLDVIRGHPGRPRVWQKPGALAMADRDLQDEVPDCHRTPSRRKSCSLRRLVLAARFSASRGASRVPALRYQRSMIWMFLNSASEGPVTPL